ncbi:hypothetical protein FOZ63_007444, partial [Perkinsus olseni]
LKPPCWSHTFKISRLGDSFGSYPVCHSENGRYNERLEASYDPVHPSLHTLGSSFPLGELHTTWLSADRIMQHGYADRLTTGDGVIVTWYSSSVVSAEAEELLEGLEDSERSLGTNKLQVKVVPREEAIALAANPLALPGRYAFAMAKLSRISPTATPTSPQPTRLPGFNKVGYESYPEAFVQYMIRMANPELFDTTTPSPQQQAEEEALSQMYAGMESEDPRLYLTYQFNENSTADADGLGRAVGQVIGDCVHLNVSRPLAGPIELCLPIAPPELLPRSTGIFVTIIAFKTS